MSEATTPEPEDAREHFRRLDGILAEAKQEVDEEHFAIIGGGPGTVYAYGYDHYSLDVKALLRLCRTGLISRKECDFRISALKRDRMVGPSIRPIYEDYVSAHRMLSELEAQADSSMKKAGL